MVLGVGTDILLIERLRRASYDKTDAFMRATYSKREKEQALERDDPTLYFSTRFAGKEAVFKSLGLDGNQGRFCEIEILNNDIGTPRVRLYGVIKNLAKQKGIGEILLSLSYDTEYATAFAVALAATDQPKEIKPHA